MSKNFKIVVGLICVIIIIGIVIFCITEKNKSQEGSEANQTNNNISNTIVSNVVDEENSKNIVNPNENNLAKINSNEDAEYGVSKLETESDVEEFNQKMLEGVYINDDFNSFMAKTVAQDIQGYAGGVHLAIEKNFFNARLLEMFGEENAKSFKFKENVEYSEDNEFISGIYEKNGYYLFDYSLGAGVSNYIDQKDKKISNNSIIYEYVYNPEWRDENNEEDFITLEEFIKEDNSLSIKELPAVTITYTKINGTYKLTSITGIEKTKEIDKKLNKDYGI